MANCKTCASPACQTAVPDQQHLRGSKVLNVLDFGAQGDWDPLTNPDADDTGAIQSAIWESQDNGAGTIYFPPPGSGGSPTGIFRISAPLEIRPSRSGRSNPGSTTLLGPGGNV